MSISRPVFAVLSLSAIAACAVAPETSGDSARGAPGTPPAAEAAPSRVGRVASALTRPSEDGNEGIFGVGNAWGQGICPQSAFSFGRGRPSPVCKMADVNGDGFADVVGFTHDVHGQVWIALSTGSGFAAPQLWVSGVCTTGQTCDAGDMDGDGSVDVIGITRGTGQQQAVTVAYSTGSGFTSPSTFILSLCAAGDVCALADVNGDGRADIVDLGQGMSNVALSAGRGFNPAAPWGASACGSSGTCLFGDVNGDHMADVMALGTDGAHNAWVSLSTGSGFGSPSAWASSMCGYLMQQCTLGDVNGDGAADIIQFEAGTNGWYDVRVALAEPRAQTFGNLTTLEPSFCTSGQCSAADVDGDGYTDLVAMVGAGPSSTISVALGANWASRLLLSGGSAFPGSAAHPVYMTYYGNFRNSQTPSVLSSFVSSVSGSQYWNMLAGYGVNPSIYLAGVQYVSGEPQGQSITTGSEIAIFQNAWGSFDPNAIYVLALGNDITQTDSGCAGGFHNYNGSPSFAYAIIENAYALPPGCVSNNAAALPQVDQYNSPNNDPEGDAMVGPLAHELAETLTDPTGNGWHAAYSSVNGTQEVGDQCVLNFGATYTTASGSVANLHLGSNDYIAQQLWSPAGTCAGAPFSPAPVSYFTFNDAQRTNLEGDLMPAANHAVRNYARAERIYARSGESLSFSGAPAHLDIANSPSLQFANTGLTVAFWIHITPGSYPSQLGHMVNVVDKQNGYSGWALSVDQNNHPFFIIDGGAGMVTSTIDLSTDTFSHHLVGTYSPGGLLRLYVDGQLTASSSVGTGIDNNQDIWAGSSQYWNNNYFVGQIDELALWNQELQPSDVQRLETMMMGNQPYGPY